MKHIAYTNATEGKLVANAAIDAVIDNEEKTDAGIEATADFAPANNNDECIKILDEYIKKHLWKTSEQVDYDLIEAMKNKIRG